MHAAIDDIHHRHRQCPRRRTAHVTVKRHVEGFGRGFCAGERNAKNGIGTKPALVWRSVQIDHDLVDPDLLLDSHIVERFEDFAVHGRDRLLYAFAEVARLVAVTELNGLMRPGGGAGRHRRAPYRSVSQDHVDLHGGVAAAIENFAADDLDDCSHECLFPCKA